MRVLVTGGAGFIGRHLVKALRDDGDKVVVLDNLKRGDRTVIPEDVSFIEGDIRDYSTVRNAMSSCDIVYHLAAQSNVMGAVNDPDYSFTSNVVGTYYVLKSAAAVGINRIVFTSSREVYGEVEKLPVTEDQPTTPKNPYGASKVAGEAYCRVAHATNGIDVNVVRLANVYGVGDHDRVIPRWLNLAQRGEDLTLYGGEQILDFVPINLVIGALRKAGEISFHGAPVNVGSGQGVSLRTLAARIRELPDVHVDMRILPARSIEVTKFAADVTRMEEILGLTPPDDPLEDLPVLWTHTQSEPQPSGPHVEG
jgi:nucleoside-diphosphate-sugar epimerase